MTRTAWEQEMHLLELLKQEMHLDTCQVYELEVDFDSV